MSRVVIIAEAGVNHNGDLSLAMQLIQAAAQAGADFVKFQSFTTEKIISKNAAKAEYQKRLTGDSDSQFEMVKKLELSVRDHRVLSDYCLKSGIAFLSTPFDDLSLKMLVEDYDVPFVKIASGELTNSPFILAAARTGKPIVLSTGMANLSEIRQALSVIAFGYMNSGGFPTAVRLKRALHSRKAKEILKEKVTLLHCTTEYPCPFEDVNLRAMQTLRRIFGLRVGYSDHTRGVIVPVAAAALGATIIEKHFTMDRNLPGPDHQASLEPSELTELVKGVRIIEQALGSGKKVPAPSEMKNLLVARKSIVAARAIQQGEVFSLENLTCKRPAGGISPTEYWNWLGKKASRSFSPEEWIE